MAEHQLDPTFCQSGSNWLQKGSRPKLWHRIAEATFDQGCVGGVDRAIGIHVGTEIGLINRRTLLRLGLCDIGRIDGAIAIGVAGQDNRID